MKDNIIKGICDCFKKNKKINEVILYGSRSKGHYKEISDIDLVLKGKDINWKDIFEIKRSLKENFSLPYQIDINILDYIKNPSLIAHIERSGKIFYKKTID